MYKMKTKRLLVYLGFFTTTLDLQIQIPQKIWLNLVFSPQSLVFWWKLLKQHISIYICLYIHASIHLCDNVIILSKCSPASATLKQSALSRPTVTALHWCHSPKMDERLRLSVWSFVPREEIHQLSFPLSKTHTCVIHLSFRNGD